MTMDMFLGYLRKNVHEYEVRKFYFIRALSDLKREIKALRFQKLPFQCHVLKTVLKAK